MNINKLIIDTLKTLNIPVSFQTYTGVAPVYITFFEYLGQGESFSEDEEESTGHYIQVDIWSKGDYSSVVPLVKSLLKSAGFKRTNETELYEIDTKINHKGVRFFYLEQI